MPYRLDIANAPPDAWRILLESGALDIEEFPTALAAILPDHVDPSDIADAFPHAAISVSEARARDAGSVWLLTPKQVFPGITLMDSDAFGTGHHPTTRLALEAVQDAIANGNCKRILDVGAGSGILAMVAVRLGVAEAVAVDIDPGAVEIAIQNVKKNGLSEQIRVAQAGPETVSGQFPLVVANILTAPLIAIATVLMRLVQPGGLLILSGIHSGLEQDVIRAYKHCGAGRIDARSVHGWVALTIQAPW